MGYVKLRIEREFPCGYKDVAQGKTFTLIGLENIGMDYDEGGSCPVHGKDCRG